MNTDPSRHIYSKRVKPLVEPSENIVLFVWFNKIRIDVLTRNLFCLKVRSVQPVRREASRAGSATVDALDIFPNFLHHPHSRRAMELSEILYNKLEYIETVIFLTGEWSAS